MTDRMAKKSVHLLVLAVMVMVIKTSDLTGGER